MTPPPAPSPRAEFLHAALWHGSLERAEAILATHPALRNSDLHIAAVLGDAEAVERFLDGDAASAHARSEPYGGTPLLYLGLSKYLRLDPSRSPDFLRAAATLLDAGADPNAGFWNEGEWETVLYGAAGVAHHAELTRLLIDRGADPNDGEVVYHSPESDDLGVIRVLVETGRITQTNLANMLVRKHDWHDAEGVTYLLEHGADPNQPSHWGFSALEHAVRRDNALALIETSLDHGANPRRPGSSRTAMSLAARRGRRDVLELFRARGFPLAFEGVERLIAACALGDLDEARTLAAAAPDLLRELLDQGSTLLAEFAGTANSRGVGCLLSLGVPVDGRYGGDGYYEIAEGSTALHVAAWRAWHETVRFLIQQGAPIDAKDARGETPLARAVKAAVDSHWSYRRSPESVQALLEAGASVAGVRYPSGYDAVDVLLRRHGAGA